MSNVSSYISRELSWVKFNARVLGEALRKSNPLLERLKFLAIVSSNFDEFFMVRVARLMRDTAEGNQVSCPSGMLPSQILEQLLEEVHEIVDQQYGRLKSKILPKLGKAGFKIIDPSTYTKEQSTYLKRMFDQEIFPMLTPIAVAEEQPILPLIANLKLHIAFRLKGKKDKDESKLTVVQVPANLDRFHLLDSNSDRVVTMLEDIIVHNGDKLFPGYKIQETCIFRLTRDADMTVDEERDEDFIEAMAEILVSRELSFPVRLEIASTDRKDLSEELRSRLGLEESNVFRVDGPLDLKSFMKLCFLPGFDEHKIEDWPPQQPSGIPNSADLWDLLKRKDVLLHHPYDSYSPVVQLVEKASTDPKVLAIKMTLYRTSGNSPIVKALARAAQNGKQVTALVELKARFDEGQNIEWARQLEKAGVIVIYGIANLKVHAKALMVVRKEADGIFRYVHLGTGNYNDTTAKLYTDMGLMTTREDITYETALFFNAITGYSSVPTQSKLIMAPNTMRPRILQLIQREIDRAGQGQDAHIIAKMNSLVDPEVIEKLYDASKAGVQIDLNVRGICCLRPKVKGLSQNIRVVSVVDRFLEHTRAFYFANGGNSEIFLSSADWMTRNISRRIELMFPVEDTELKAQLTAALQYYFTDTSNAHELREDGSYSAIKPKRDEKPRRSQAHFYREACQNAQRMAEESRRKLSVRRKAPQ